MESVYVRGTCSLSVTKQPEWGFRRTIGLAGHPPAGADLPTNRRFSVPGVYRSYVLFQGVSTGNAGRRKGIFAYQDQPVVSGRVRSLFGVSGAIRYNKSHSNPVEK